MFGEQLAESSVRSSHISAHINKPPQSTEPSASKPVVDDLSDFAGGAVRGGLPYEVEDADPGAALIYTGDFVAGLIGGSVGVALGHPFDTLKTRQQILGGSLANCVRTTIRNDGPKGFFKGLAFPLGAVGGLNAIFFGVYGLSLKQLGTWRHGDPDAAPMYSDIFLAGCFSGAVQAIPAAPIELVKVKLMCQTGRQGIYTGPLQCLRSIYRNHGMRGCFRGLTATGMREVPGLSVYITTYTYLCDQMISDGHEHCSVRASLFAGGMAGMLSWTVNLPIDIVKSRLQADNLSKPRYSGMFHCAKEVFKEAGLKAFWRGLPVVCLRAFPVNAVTFAVYSVSLRYFNALSEEKKQCAAYQWGAWTPCYGTTTCQDDPAVFNFPLQATTTDQGRAMMAHMMADKQRQMEYKAECRANGECPEFMDRDSEGEAQCVDGFASSYPCRNIDLLSFINITDLGYVEPATGEVIPALNDMWGWTDEQEGEEYAIVGLTGGSSFVRVTDPQNPEVLGFLYTHTHAITWRDMKVVNDHAYIVAESLDHGVQVFDLRRLRGRTADDFEYFEVDAHYDGIGRAHNIAANPDTQTLFVVGCTDVAGRSNYTVCEGGLHMIDVSDPQNPQFAGCYSDDGYTHDTHCVIYHGPDERYTGREICMAFNEDSLTVVDVTDREFPVMVAKSGYATCRYAHQGWLTEDHRFVFGDDELDEVVSTDRHTKTYFWDVQDLQNPTLKWIYQSAETSIDHNLYITGPWVVQSNYEAGLRFLYFDSETEEVVETGHFDVLPSRTTVTFSGTWSNYPWYKNGMVAVTSIDYGLFLVQPNYEAMEAEAGRSIGSGHQSRMRSVPEMDGSGECARVESRNCNC